MLSVWNQSKEWLKLKHCMCHRHSTSIAWHVPFIRRVGMVVFISLISFPTQCWQCWMMCNFSTWSKRDSIFWTPLRLDAKRNKSQLHGKIPICSNSFLLKIKFFSLRLFTMLCKSTLIFVLSTACFFIDLNYSFKIPRRCWKYVPQLQVPKHKKRCHCRKKCVFY